MSSGKRPGTDGDRSGAKRQGTDEVARQDVPVRGKRAVRAAVPRAPPTCPTRPPPGGARLVGGEGFHAVWNRREDVAEESGLHLHQIEHLLTRYGTRIFELLALIDERPELAEGIPGTKTYLCVEAAYAASHEGALHIDDVLTRRTRISIETFDRGVEAAERVAQEMGAVLGWDPKKRKREVDHYVLRVRAERESQEQPDDQSADAARLGAPDLRGISGEARAQVMRLVDEEGDVEAESAS